MWLGPAPVSEYDPQRCHFNWRYFSDYGHGVFGDFWSHIADVAYWALQPQGLKSIHAKGEQNTGISNVQRWIDVDYEYEDLNVYWTSTVPNVPGAASRSNIGAYFEGDKGTLICDYNTHEVRIAGELVPDLTHVPITLERSPGHQQNFVNAVKSRKPRKRKAKSADQLVSKLNYAKDFAELKLVSVDPKTIVGANQLWVYNTKTRKLGCYNAEDAAGLSIKGSTIQNFAESKSIQKTLRKPAVTLPEVLKGGKVALRNVLTDIRAAEGLLTGRINADTILLRTIK
jgi:hypothetical protein